MYILFTNAKMIPLFSHQNVWIALHASTSRSKLQAAFAGLVEGRTTTSRKTEG
jgi:hypothetical protein